METITSFAFSLENELNPPHRQQSGLEESFPSVGPQLVHEDTHIRTFPLGREIRAPHVQGPSLSFQHYQNLTSFRNSQLHYSFYKKTTSKSETRKKSLKT